MADRPRTQRNDGVTMAPGTSPGKAIALLAVAVSLACLALLVLFGRPTREPSPPEAPPLTVLGASEERGEGVAAPALPAESPPPVAEAEPATERAATPKAESPSEIAEAAEAGDAPVLPSGLGLFPPPGTDPLKIGLVVPDDFELPEGYLRHYQVTDDGQELPPILLFHPDYEVLGPDGEPLQLPENLIVPPVLAPPGLPIQLLVPPPPREEEGR